MTPLLVTHWGNLDGIADAVVQWLPSLVVAIVVFVLFSVAAVRVKGVIQRGGQQARIPTSTAFVLGRIAQWAVAVFGLLVALSVALPGFRAGDLVQFLGIGSVAVGFAFRDILQNFLAGILLLLTRPFRIGDQIIVRTYEGTVEDIQTRATLIKTYDGRRVLIPNATVFTEAITVNTAFEIRRTEYDVVVESGVDLDRTKGLILDRVHSVHGVVRELPADAFVTAIADGRVTIRIRWWTDSRRADVVAVQDQVITAINQAFAGQEIALSPSIK